MANLWVNGKSIDSLNEIAENFFDADIVKAFDTGVLAEWLEEFGYDEEAVKIREIKSHDNIVNNIVIALGLNEEIVKASQGRILIERKSEKERILEKERRASLQKEDTAKDAQTKGLGDSSIQASEKDVKIEEGGHVGRFEKNRYNFSYTEEIEETGLAEKNSRRKVQKKKMGSEVKNKSLILEYKDIEELNCLRSGSVLKGTVLVLSCFVGCFISMLGIKRELYINYKKIKAAYDDPVSLFGEGRAMELVIKESACANNKCVVVVTPVS